MILMTIILFIIGFFDYDCDNSAVAWTQASFMAIWTFVLQTTDGAIYSVIFSESYATPLRSRMIAIANAAKAAQVSFSQPHCPISWASRTAIGAGNAGIRLVVSVGLLCLVLFQTSRVQGSDFEEIDVMIERMVPPRKFREYDPLAVGEEHT